MYQNISAKNEEKTTTSHAMPTQTGKRPRPRHQQPEQMSRPQQIRLIQSHLCLCMYICMYSMHVIQPKKDANQTKPNQPRPGQARTKPNRKPRQIQPRPGQPASHQARGSSPASQFRIDASLGQSRADESLPHATVHVHVFPSHHPPSHMVYMELKPTENRKEKRNQK